MEFDNINLNKTAFANGKRKENLQDFNINNITPLITLDALQCSDKALLKEEVKTFDAWKNHIASIGSNNSLQQFTKYTFNRLTYPECASLATDSMIHKALEVIVEECFNHGGNFVFADNDTEEKLNFDLDAFNKDFKNNGFFDVARKAFLNGLIFGGAFIYINTTDTDLNKQLYKDNSSNNKFINFRNLEPWQFAPSQTNTYNPIKSDYMNPSSWYVMNAGQVHTSRFIKVIPFTISDLYKPMFNYLGLPLSFFMRDYVSVADSIRQSLGDLFLRFSTVVVKVPNHKVSNEEGYNRVKHIVATRNNLGAVVLAGDEDYIVDNFSLTGLYDIVQHAYELVTATSYVPTVKLLGIEPSGFNSTGEFSMKNFQDTISAFQRNIISPFLVEMAEVYASLKLNKKINLNFEWKPLGQISQVEEVELSNSKADFLIKLKDNDILSAEDVLTSLQNNDITLLNVDVDNLPDPDKDEEGFYMNENGEIEEVKQDKNK